MNNIHNAGKFLNRWATDTEQVKFMNTQYVSRISKVIPYMNWNLAEYHLTTVIYSDWQNNATTILLYVVSSNRS